MSLVRHCVACCKERQSIGPACGMRRKESVEQERGKSEVDGGRKTQTNARPCCQAIHNPCEWRPPSAFGYSPAHCSSFSLPTTTFGHSVFPYALASVSPVLRLFTQVNHDYPQYCLHFTWILLASAEPGPRPHLSLRTTDSEEDPVSFEPISTITTLLTHFPAIATHSLLLNSIACQTGQIASRCLSFTASAVGSKGHICSLRRPSIKRRAEMQPDTLRASRLTLG